MVHETAHDSSRIAGRTFSKQLRLLKWRIKLSGCKPASTELSELGDVRGLDPNRNRMIEEIEISQNDKCLVRTIAGVAPADTIFRVEKFRHQPIWVVINFISFEDAGALEFGEAFQFVAGKSAEEIQN